MVLKENGFLVVNNEVLPHSKQYKYLGHIIDNKINDDADMLRQRKQFYFHSNVIARKFKYCCEQTKTFLLIPIVDPFILLNYGVNLKMLPLTL